MAASQLSLIMKRGFSTTLAVRGKLVKAPLTMFGIDGRYATALYSAASKEKKLDAVEKDMKVLQDLLKTDKKFADCILNPTLPKQIKKNVFQSVLQKKSASNITQNFCAALVDNGRLNKMSAIANAFSRIMSAHRGEVVCEITSAKPLDSGTQTELTSALHAFLKKGETIKIVTKVDPEIIGGLIVSIGDKYVDMSLASKVKNYSNLLRMPV